MQIGPFEAQDQLDELNELFDQALAMTENAAEREDQPGEDELPPPFDVIAMPHHPPRPLAYDDNPMPLQERIDNMKAVYENERRIKGRVLINALIAGRVMSGISKAEMSSRVGVCLDDLADIEDSNDEDLTLRDLVTYSSALNVLVDVKFIAKDDSEESVNVIRMINQAIRGDES